MGGLFGERFEYSVLQLGNLASLFQNLLGERLVGFLEALSVGGIAGGIMLLLTSTSPLKIDTMSGEALKSICLMKDVTIRQEIY